MSNVPPPIDYASLGYMPQPKPKRYLFGWMLFVGLVVMFFLLMRQGRASTPAVSFGQFQTDLVAGKVRTVTVSPDELEYTTTGPINTNSRGTGSFLTIAARVRIAQDMGKDFHFIQWLSQSHNDSPPPDVQFANDQNLVINLLLPLIPWLLIFGFIYFFVFRQLRNAKNQQWQKPMPVVIVNPDSLPKP